MREPPAANRATDSPGAGERRVAKPRLRVGTRPSPLARAQARLAAEALGCPYELVVIRTTGDEPPAAGTADKGRFVKELELALLAGRIDVAVHSAKDVPSELPPGLVLAAAAARADPRDVLVGARSLADLPTGARIGTASLRRRAQLLAARADLRVLALRGNVDTRLSRLREDRFDAIVLAAAGLERLGIAWEGAPIPASQVLPAPGQGTLVYEVRADDERALALCRAACDRRAWAELRAERALVAALEASCDTPLAALARCDPRTGEIAIEGWAGAPDGSAWVRDRVTGTDSEPEALGRVLAARLRSAGAIEVMRGERPPEHAPA